MNFIFERSKDYITITGPEDAFGERKMYIFKFPENAETFKKCAEKVLDKLLYV